MKRTYIHGIDEMKMIIAQYHGVPFDNVTIHVYPNGSALRIEARVEVEDQCTRNCLWCQLTKNCPYRK